MIRRFRALFPPVLFASLEAALMGLFFVQSLRLMIGLLYSRTSSAALISTFPEGVVPPTVPGYVSADALSVELGFLGVLFGLPILMTLFSRFRWAAVLMLLVAAGARVLVVLPDAPISQLLAAQIVVAAGIGYIVTLIARRARLFPAFFILGFALDQTFRAFGNTFDPSMQTSYLNVQIGLSVALLLVAFLSSFRARTAVQVEEGTNMDTNRGTLSLWGGVGVGALLYLQLSLFALPNALAARTAADYTLFVPVVLACSLLPLIPAVRTQARALIAPFDSGTRGWLWLVIIAALVIVGLRVPRVGIAGNDIMVGAVVLSIAQILISLLWWWFVRPRATRERTFTGLWVAVGGAVLALFIGLDTLTYDYAFVQGFAPPLDALNAVVVPLMRGFRGLGLGVILLAVFLATVPMILSTRRVAWVPGTRLETAGSLLATVALVAVAGYFARPVAVVPQLNLREYRIGTYNIHNGFSEFYDHSLRGIAAAIQESGVQILLMQDVDAGRLTSFGVDQALWLARTLRMDMRYFGTVESLTGLAVLSRVPIVYDDGFLLPSVDQQAGLQRVQVQPDQNVIKIYNTALGVLLAGDTIEEQEAGQRAQLNAILAIIRTHIETDYGGQLGRTILGGTFNNIPDSPLLQILRNTGFVDPFAGAPRERSDTLIRIDRSARVDYLWIWRETLTPLGYNVVRDNAASDHRLAFVGLEG